jgi:hypothetical protein
MRLCLAPSLFVYLFILSWSSCIYNHPAYRLLESPSNLTTCLHQTHHLRAPLPRRQAPRSRFAHLDRALQYYECLPCPLPSLSPSSSEVNSARLLNDVLRELPGKSFSAPKHPRRTLPGLLLRAALTGDWAAGAESGGNGRAWEFDLLVTS